MGIVHHGYAVITNKRKCQKEPNAHKELCLKNLKAFIKKPRLRSFEEGLVDTGPISSVLGFKRRR
jgi:hypothetical protein